MSRHRCRGEDDGERVLVEPRDRREVLELSTKSKSDVLENVPSFRVRNEIDIYTVVEAPSQRTQLDGPRFVRIRRWVLSSASETSLVAE